MVMKAVYRSMDGILAERDDGDKSVEYQQNKRQSSNFEHLDCPASGILRFAVRLDLVNAGARECSIGQTLVSSPICNRRSGQAGPIDGTARFQL